VLGHQNDRAGLAWHSKQQRTGTVSIAEPLHPSDGPLVEAQPSNKRHHGAPADDGTLGDSGSNDAGEDSQCVPTGGYRE
jgi:hypothetical protein